jgi:hypothetical protein
MLVADVAQMVGFPTVAMALNPATPAPMTSTLQGGIYNDISMMLGTVNLGTITFPAAVT